MQKLAIDEGSGVARTGEKFARFIFQAWRCFVAEARLSFDHIHGPFWAAGGIMTWTAPAFEEVCLNCEINSYASAKL